MKRILFILLFVLFLVGCSNSNVEDGEFVFTEDEFQEVYEETNDKNMPTNVTYYPGNIHMEFGDKNDAIEFLNAISELFESDEARRLSDSIENNEDNIPGSIEGDEIYMIMSDENSWYDIYVTPNE
ncbi:hypothetical protein [Oceanobacillus jeddahense]|uniref:hypothetical protein n=1 Tax=Oceanobacillus jeddahense TaxID=1462527 RepID=UPI000595E137|nr:hypothetical protein [Oceanobacillus jeddahense]